MRAAQEFGRTVRGRTPRGLEWWLFSKAARDEGRILGQMRHFAQCKGDTVLQVHGVGPFVINFISPDETPAKKPA